MVDEKKVRIMTDIARDEKNLDKKILKYGGYYKKDYVIKLYGTLKNK